MIEDLVRASVIAIGIAIVGVPVPPSRVISSEYPRDRWYLDCKNGICEEVSKINGVASWYDATKNNAWYTTDTVWGKSVKFYGAAGPKLRKMIEDFYETDIGGSAYWQRLAGRDNRPVVLITSKKTGESIRVTITDWCGCRGGKEGPEDDKIIDLSPKAFEALGLPLEVGIMKVTIEPIK